jgi:hypothetical protein
VYAENLIRLIWRRNHVTSATLLAVLFFLLRLLVSPFSADQPRLRMPRSDVS